MDLVREVVSTNDKKRFVLDEASKPPRIRAAQGHSVELDAPVLTPVTDAATVPVALHVTSSEGWKAIQSSGEVRPMSRTHVHFATQPHHLRRNKWATELLRLDVAAALAAGLELGLSTNGVLLCATAVPVGMVSRIDSEGELPGEWRSPMARGEKTPGQAGAGLEGGRLEVSATPRLEGEVD